MYLFRYEIEGYVFKIQWFEPTKKFNLFINDKNFKEFFGNFQKSYSDNYLNNP